MDKILWKRGKGKGLTERTLVFFKPETVKRRLMGEVLSRMEKKGLTIKAMKLTQITQEQAEKIYEMHKNKIFYERLIKHITSAPVLAMIVESPDSVSTIREMIGETDPLKAQPGTIRGDLSLSIHENIIHAADSIENAEREIKILFKPEEILE